MSIQKFTNFIDSQLTTLQNELVQKRILPGIMTDNYDYKRDGGMLNMLMATKANLPAYYDLYLKEEEKTELGE